MSEELLKKAYFFAQEKHKNQKDDDKSDYFFSHLYQVFEILWLVTQDTEILSAAFLHDTIEDTATTYEELVEHFGQRVADLVMEVTQEEQADNKGYYFPRLHSKEGIMIKFADRLSNLSRMTSWAPKRQEQYLRESKFWKSE